MAVATLEKHLYAEISRIPLLDPHSHIQPLSAAAKNLDEILGYHYYTELAHSAGMSKDCLASNHHPLERVRTLLTYARRFANTAQYGWLLEIAQTFLGFQGKHLTEADTEQLWQAAQERMEQPDWETQVLQTTNVERIFLTNDFDDPLEGFNTYRYVPCLRTDDLVFHLHKPAVRQRLEKVAGLEVTSAAKLREALAGRFAHFVRNGAKACAISLPPSFTPTPVHDHDLSAYLQAHPPTAEQLLQGSLGVFWMLAELCQEHRLPFDLMIGVNRAVYRSGVFQGQDLFDRRTSLLQYADLFNAFPSVTFCVSVLDSAQNAELLAYSWIFPNVVTSGHWWYGNLPALIEQDAAARLQGVPLTKQIAYYSDAYKLEFILPKFNMYRRILARILVRDFIHDRSWNEEQALDLARQLLRGNVERIFQL
jgi:glucuronate isomerase